MVRRALRVGDASRSCTEYYSAMKDAPEEAAAWCRQGSYFPWKSTQPEHASNAPLRIFSICLGKPENPAILLLHGYPTSSFDFAEVARELSDQYYVCALDTPGYGFSDKPKPSYHYSIFDDARLADHFIRDVAHLKYFSLVTHDKGDSVGLALLQLYQSESDRPYTIRHHFILNGNVYLPLAQLSVLQKLLLSPQTGPVLSTILDGDLLAHALGFVTFSPPLHGEAVRALASVLDYQDGVRVEHDIIQYLNERRAHEVEWLEALTKSDVPTTVIWGEQDGIAPTAVADFVWSHSLEGRAAPADAWRIPCASHYVQSDHPRLVAELIRNVLTPGRAWNAGQADDCEPRQIHRNKGDAAPQAP